MFSIYETTDQGKRTRSQLIAVLQRSEGLTRNEIVAASEGTLTYDQVRRQTNNLILEQQIRSRVQDGQRRYYLHEPAIERQRQYYGCQFNRHESVIST